MTKSQLQLKKGVGARASFFLPFSTFILCSPPPPTVIVVGMPMLAREKMHKRDQTLRKRASDIDWYSHA